METIEQFDQKHKDLCVCRLYDLGESKKKKKRKVPVIDDMGKGVHRNSLRGWRNIIKHFFFNLKICTLRSFCVMINLSNKKPKGW